MNRLSPLFRRISPSILLLPGFNPGPLTLEGTNTYILGSTAQRLLIDTGERGNHKYLSNLLSTMKSEQFSITKIAITHSHEAHMGGLSEVLTLTKCAEILMNYNHQDYTIHRVSDFERLKIDEDLTVTFIHTPGHTADHTSIWIEESGDLFTGDCVIGGESAQFQDLQQQIDSVNKLRELEGLTRIHPGKGTCDERNPYQKEYRLKREQEILKKFETQGKMTHAELTQFFYGQRFKKDDPRYEAGKQNMLAHLKKLAQQGKITSIAENYRLN